MATKKVTYVTLLPEHQKTIRGMLLAITAEGRKTMEAPEGVGAKVAKALQDNATTSASTNKALRKLAEAIIGVELPDLANAPTGPEVCSAYVALWNPAGDNYPYIRKDGDTPVPIVRWTNATETGCAFPAGKIADDKWASRFEVGNTPSFSSCGNTYDGRQVWRYATDAEIDAMDLSVLPSCLAGRAFAEFAPAPIADFPTDDDDDNMPTDDDD